MKLKMRAINMKIYIIRITSKKKDTFASCPKPNNQVSDNNITKIFPNLNLNQLFFRKSFIFVSKF